MKLVHSTALLLALSAVAGIAAQGAPDLTVRTRTTSGGGVVDTVTLQATASRRRLTRTTQFPDGTRASSVTSILQCDRHRTLLLDDLTKLYAVEPERPIARGTMLRGDRATTITRPNGEVRTIDAVDTGERRVYGPVTARHVVTTTTSERDGVAPHIVGIRDGWYIDAPARSCEPGGASESVLVASNDGGMPVVRWKGRARTGYPIEERDRIFDRSVTIERKTELVDVSGAPIPASALDIPDGYKPALERPGGGFDMSRPDTVVNRVVVLWEMTVNWVRSFLP